MLNLMKNYLTNRQQLVFKGNMQSELLLITGHNPWRTFVRRGPARTRADSAGLRADSSGVRPKFRLGGVRLAGGQSGGSPPDFRHFWRTPSGSERPRGGMAEVSASWTLADRPPRTNVRQSAVKWTHRRTLADFFWSDADFRPRRTFM